MWTNLDRFEAPDRSFIGHRDIVTASMARYYFVAPHVRGAVIDIGCGRGYGLEAVRGSTTPQVGADISEEFLLQARNEFPKLELVRATGHELPFAAHSFDSLIAFEVIEHIEQDLAFLAGLKRVARPDAMIAISTPNRDIVSGTAMRPLNRFHVREYSANEFHQLLAQTFSAFRLYGQHDPAGNLKSNSWMDRVPVRWKYWLPVPIVSLVSVALRRPLQIQDFRFDPDDLDHAHTFVALCQV